MTDSEPSTDSEWESPGDQPEPMATVLAGLVGQPCWRTTGGGAARSAVLLELGDKVPRERPLSARAKKRPFHEFQGSASLFTRDCCPWTLRHGVQVVAVSSHWDAGAMEAVETHLVGRTITAVAVGRDDWSLRLSFDGDRHFELRPDDDRTEEQLPEDTYYEDYWCVSQGSLYVSGGPLDRWHWEDNSQLTEE